MLLAIRYVTREAFIRGPILHRVLGPRYENNLRIGTIRVGLFPPRIRMFNVELIDRRPGPDEPVVVASLGKMALDFRLLPSNTLMVDRVELRGLELEVRRNERGGVNLLRALADMQEGRVPSPIRYEALTGTEASGRRILVGFWDAGNWRVHVIDHYDRATPRQADLLIADARLLRGDPTQPLDLANGLPLGLQGYFQSSTGESPVWRPVRAELTVTQPFNPPSIGIDLRGEVKPPLANLGVAPDSLPGLLETNRPVPDWTTPLLNAPVVITFRGSYANSLLPREYITNIEFSIRDAGDSGALFTISDGRYDLHTGRITGRLRAEGSPARVLRGLQQFPLPPSPTADAWKSLPAPFRDAETTPTAVVLELSGEFDPDSTPPQDLTAERRLFRGLTFRPVHGSLRLDAAVVVRDVPVGGHPVKPAAAQLRVTSRLRLGLHWPDLTLRVGPVDCQLELKEQATTAGGTPGEPGTATPPESYQVLLTAKTENDWIEIPPEELRTALTTFTTSSSYPLESPPVTTAESPLTVWPELDQGCRVAAQIQSRLFGVLRLAHNVPMRLDLQVPPVGVRSVSPLLGAHSLREAVAGQCSGRLNVRLFPEAGISGKIELEGQVAGFKRRPDSTPLTLTTHANLLWTTDTLEIDPLRAVLATSPENTYDFEIRNSRIELARREGEFHLQSHGIDPAFSRTVWELGGSGLLPWPWPSGTNERLPGPSLADLLVSTTLDLRLDTFLAERTYFDSTLEIRGLSSADVARDPARFTPYSLTIRTGAGVDRRKGVLEVDAFSGLLTGSGQSPFRLNLDYAGLQPITLQVSRTGKFATAVSTLVREGVAVTDRAETATLSHADSFLGALERLRGAHESPEALEFTIQSAGFPWGALSGLLEIAGIEGVGGKSDLTALVRLTTDRPQFTDDNSARLPALAEWTARAQFNPLTIGADSTPIQGILDARGTFTRRQASLDDLQASAGQSILKAVGTYDVARRQGRATVEIDNVGEREIAAISRLRGFRPAEALQLERQFPLAWIAALDTGDSRNTLQWSARQGDGGQRLQVDFARDARGIESEQGPANPLRIHTEGRLQFSDANTMSVETFQMGCLTDNASTPVLAIRLDCPVSLVRSNEKGTWRDMDTGTSASLSLDVTGDVDELSRLATAVPIPLVGRRVQGGEIHGEFACPFSSGEQPARESTLAGTIDDLRLEGLPRSYDFSFRGLLGASENEVSLRDLQILPRGGKGIPSRARLNGRWGVGTGERALDFALEKAGPELLELVAGPWRPILAADNTLADLAVTAHTQRHGAPEERETHLSARHCALSRRGFDPLASGAPLHPPLAIDYDQVQTADAESSSILVRSLEFRAVPEEDPTGPALVYAVATGPIRLIPRMRTVVSPSPGLEPAPQIRVQIGPVEMAPYGEALAPWIGFPLGSGVAVLDATFTPSDSRPDLAECALVGSLRVERVDIRRPLGALPEPTESVPAPVAESDSLPLSGSVQFRIRSSAGVVSLEDVTLDSANSGDLPPDHVVVDGTVYGTHRGFSPDVQLRGDFLNLNKYWALVSRALASRERRTDEGSVRELAATKSRREPTGPTVNSADLPSSPVTRLRLRLDLDALRFRRSTLRAVSGLARVEDKTARISDFSAELGSGQIYLDGRADFAANPAVAYESDLRLEKVRLESLLDMVAPTLAGKVQALVTGRCALRGAGITRENLERHLTAAYSLRLDSAQIEHAPDTWILGRLDNLTGHVVGGIREGNADVQLTPDPEAAPKAVWLRGYVKDVFDRRYATARIQFLLRTVVGPIPRDSSRTQPIPQDLLGAVYRVSGPIDDPRQLRFELESYEY